MPKFNPGDRVVVVYESTEDSFGSGSGEYFKLGDKGTVERYHENGAVRVRFDDSLEYWAQEEELALHVIHIIEQMLE